MRVLLALAVTLAMLAPAASAGPAGVTDPTGLVLRVDDDGMASLLLHVEDSPGGVVTTMPVNIAQTSPTIRQVGVYTRVYEGYEGAPTVSGGVYVLGTALALRVPLVIVENAQSTGDVSADLLETLALATQTGNLAVPFVQEILLPELAANFGQTPDAARFSTYRDHPTTYVWTAHRAVPGAEAWAGTYLARTGSVTLGADGRVAQARADAELGAAVRLGPQTTRAAATYLETTYDAAAGDQTQRITVGAAAAGARTPIASMELSDARVGSDLAGTPDGQATRATLGVHAAGAFVPLVGVETTQTARPSQTGTEITRITGIGAFTPEGAFVPIAGARYHSDTGNLLQAIGALAGDGPGSPAAGNFEIDVGPFVEGEYVPAAGAVHRDHFREMHYSYATMLAAGVYTPVGFSPIAVATYDGSLPLVDWAFVLLRGEADGMEWMLAAGTMAAGTYVPLVGVGTIGAAPLQERAEGYEVRAGIFAGSYHAFVPLVSLAYDGDTTPGQHLVAFAGGTFGAEAGAFDVRVGTYAAGDYVGLAGAQFRSDFDGAGANETMIVLGAYAGNEFVPLVGVLYSSDDTFLGSLNNAFTPVDDDRSRFYAGVFVQGEWVPVVMVQNSGDGIVVLALPDV